MNTVQQLADRIRRAVETSNSAATIEALITEPVELSPWQAWTLIGQVGQRARQRWLTEIVRTRLQGSPEALSACGAFGHPEDMPRQGVVPGLIEWEYYFHGRGCCLTHRTTGESIDVDFHGDSGDYVDEWFYRCYLQSLKQPEYPEKRLIELHPSFESLAITLEELKKRGLLQTRPKSKAFTLARACEELGDLGDAFAALLNEPEKELLASVAVGDWLRATELAGNCSEADMLRLQRLADDARTIHIEVLLRYYKSSQWQREALLGLMDANAPQVDHFLKAILRGRPDGTTSVALETLLRRQDPAWCDEVYSLCNRLDPRRDILEPHVWQLSCEFLLRTGYRIEEVKKALLRATDRATADAALLALEFAPEHARVLYERALKSSVPVERMKAAATLAVLDEPWGISLLIAALNGSSDRTFTAPLRGALACSRELRAHEAVLAWEAKYPYQPSTGIGYTWDDVAEASRDSQVQYDMAQLHDRVLPLRGRVK